ncbi:MAG: hypothetical protein ACP5T1_06870 [Thermoplasmata archaeon]
MGSSKMRVLITISALLGILALSSFAGIMVGVTGFNGNLNMLSAGYELNSQTFAFANFIFPLGLGIGVGSSIGNIFPTINFGNTSTGSPIGNMNIGWGVVVQGDFEMVSGITGLLIYGGPAFIIKTDLPIIYSKFTFFTSVGLAYASAAYQGITGAAIAYGISSGIYYVF